MKESLFFIISLILLTSVCDTISQLFLKTTINRLDFNIDSFKKIMVFIGKLLLTPRIYIGFLFSCLSLSIWLYVLSKTDLNFAFTIDSMHYIFIALASSLILKEKVGYIRWIGTILIVAGIALVTLSY
ncbi:MAG: EamA family transporter [Candidatus Omnitrophota bacterium]